ncbi:MAG TPA: CoA-binding protein [Candidatus Limnocylindrales bacterium]|jgi:hypothetical protein|nr:CoA-binding protein [Candidatus Limnocylindrales bacterium]
MIDAADLLRTVRSVLVIDWPTKDLPETLSRAGYTVFVKAGPGDDDYVLYEAADDGSIRRRPMDRPERIDLVHVYRPIEELPGYVDLAVGLGATAVWVLSGLSEDGSRDRTGCWLPADQSAEARRIVESAGLAYVERPAILEAVHAAGIDGARR